jgi:hypothetical protein
MGRDVLLRLRRLHRILAGGGAVDGWIGEVALAGAISEIERLRQDAARGRWLVDKLSERTTPDGRTVLEISEVPIWCKQDGTLADYRAAVDAAMELEA